MTRQEKELLESLIDRYNMAEVLNALSEIAYEKADHVRTNWNDEPLARAWEASALAIDKAEIKTIEQLRRFIGDK